MTAQKVGQIPENMQNSGWTSVTGSAYVEIFFEKNWSKVTFAQFFAALQETFRGKDEIFFSVLREIVPHFFEKSAKPFTGDYGFKNFSYFFAFFLLENLKK